MNEVNEGRDLDILIESSCDVSDQQILYARVADFSHFYSLNYSTICGNVQVLIVFKYHKHIKITHFKAI